MLSRTSSLENRILSVALKFKGLHGDPGSHLRTRRVESVWRILGFSWVGLCGKSDSSLVGRCI